MSKTTRLAMAIAVVFLASAAVLSAGVAERTYEFKLDDWMSLEVDETPIELHRLRMDRIEGRLTKSALSRPHNQEYLETVRIQLEYTNSSDRKWKARLNVRWLDADGQVIDGFSANETLEKRSARKIVQTSVSTLVYGLEQAETLEVEIHYDP